MVSPAFSSLICSIPLAHAAFGGAPVRVLTDTLPFDTTQVVVAEADFAQLKTFLQATSSLWGQESMKGLMQRHLVQYPMALGNTGGAAAPQQISAGAMIPIPNYALIADSVSDVAKGLASAKLTGRRYMQLSRTLNIAYVTEQLDRLGHNGTPQVKDTTTIIGKNVAFIRAHQADFNTLVQLALDVIPLQQGGGMGGGMGDDDN